MNQTHSNGVIFQLVGSVLLAATISLTAASQQTTRQTAIPVSVDPPKATMYVGESQTFAAAVGGTRSAAVKWSIQEPEGGRITGEGVYTAPKTIGIYHIVTARKTDSSQKAIATITVVEHSDVPSTMQ